MTDTTHAQGCWGWGPRHYECAVGQIERGAALEGFGFIGIEIDPYYLAISEARIKAAGAVV